MNQATQRIRPVSQIGYTSYVSRSAGRFFPKEPLRTEEKLLHLYVQKTGSQSFRELNCLFLLHPLGSPPSDFSMGEPVPKLALMKKVPKFLSTLSCGKARKLAIGKIDFVLDAGELSADVYYPKALRNKSVTGAGYYLEALAVNHLAHDKSLAVSSVSAHPTSNNQRLGQLAKVGLRAAASPHEWLLGLGRGIRNAVTLHSRTQKANEENNLLEKAILAIRSVWKKAKHSVSNFAEEARWEFRTV
jgi:hypothetical protein